MPLAPYKVLADASSKCGLFPLLLWRRGLEFGHFLLDSRLRMT
jgi:hypothetical protein